MLWRRFLCFIGYHRWTWTLKDGETICLAGSPPRRAACDFCGEIYGKEKS